MVKRILITAGTATVLAVLFFGRDAASYVRTSVGYVKDSVRNSVPVEFQLQRARQMLKDLVPEVQKNVHLIAKEEVEIERLQGQLAATRSRLNREREQLVVLKDSAATGKASFQFGGRRYTLEQVKMDLAQRFDRYKTGEATATSLEQMQAARQRGLDAARQKLEGMLAARRQLQVEIENLEARNQMVAAAHATSNYQFDESRLGRLKELISDLRTRIEVNERLVSTDIQLHDEIPVDRCSPDDVVAQIGRYFDGAGSAAAVSVQQEPAAVTVPARSEKTAKR